VEVFTIGGAPTANSFRLPSDGVADGGREVADGGREELARFSTELTFSRRAQVFGNRSAETVRSAV